MKHTITQVTSAIALLGVLAATALQSAPAQAAPAKNHHKYHNINARQTNQQKRIYAGIHHGSLTYHEATELEKREANIARAEAHARNSGDKFTKRERLNIERRDNRVSRDIYQQKHDRQHR